MSSPSKTAVGDLLETNEMSISSLVEESGSVYRLKLTDDSSPTRYVKVFPKEQQEHFFILNELGEAVGMPKSEVFVNEEFGLHVMVPAAGTALSYQLPKYLVPGVWRQRRRELQAGIHKLGHYLRTLHENSRCDQTMVTVDSIYIDKYDAVVGCKLDTQLHRILDNDVASAVERVLAQRPEVDLKRSLIHGDLILLHVFYHKKDVTIIDFDRVEVGGSLEDCLSFECTLDLMVSRLPYARRKQFTQLMKSFYNGYGTIPTETIADLLKLIKFCSLLLYYIQKTDPFWKSPSLSQRQLTRDIDVFILKRRIKELATRLQ